MVKSVEESARERRNYVEQARAAFRSQQPGNIEEPAPAEEAGTPASTFGIRLVIALLLFAGFVYCDQEKITFQGIGSKQVVEQIEWNPLPVERLDAFFGDVSITSTKEKADTKAEVKEQNK
ncbi:MAG: hypothetical protein HFH36_02345 [Lachnospiraceae bacterium]|nr:hypothetical protein [Lachnospiraceae bacterium]